MVEMAVRDEDIDTTDARVFQELDASERNPVPASKMSTWSPQRTSMHGVLPP
jgi:hypothetical protein